MRSISEKAANKAGQLAERLLKLDLIILMSWATCRSARQAGPRCSICSASCMNAAS
jgi:hypothetical protein